MEDDNSIDDLIKEVAVKHGIALGKDDPVLMLHTINRKLIKEGIASQEQILETFKGQLEEIAHRWSEDSKSKAERVLNASLAASKEAMAAGVKEASKIAATELSRVIKESEASVTKTVDGVRRASIINLAASLLVLIAVLVLLVTQ
jgi:hypothetical protein